MRKSIPVSKEKEQQRKGRIEEEVQTLGDNSPKRTITFELFIHLLERKVLNGLKFSFQ